MTKSEGTWKSGTTTNEFKNSQRGGMYARVRISIRASSEPVIIPQPIAHLFFVLTSTGTTMQATILCVQSGVKYTKRTLAENPWVCQ
jgi:hypothetical protein